MENIFSFKYLVYLFSFNELHIYDIKARITKAQVRYGQLRSIFDSPDLCVQIKIRVYMYIDVIFSLMTFGSETWDLSPDVCQHLNNTNSLMLSHITGKSIRDEAHAYTITFNLVRNIKHQTTPIEITGEIL